VRRNLALAVLVSGAVVGSAFVATPALAAAEPWNTVFTPPASADHNAIPPVNAPTSPWKPGVGGSNASGSAKTQAKVASPQAVTSATVGAPGLGSLPYFTFDKTELSLDVVAQVNVANGNLLLTSNDGVLNGAGLSLRNDRFYNGLSTQNGAFGGGWSSTLSQTDVGIKTDSTSATFTGPNGFTAKFTKSGSAYTAPSGFNATLTADSSSTTKAFTLQYNSSGEKLTFSSSGYLTTDTDRNGTGSTYSYDANGRVNTVSTASGRQYTIGWSGGTPAVITGISDSAGRNVQYDTDPSGRLVKVTKPDGNIEQYTYDSAGRVATVQTTGTGNGDTVTTFGYDASNRVTSLSVAKTNDATVLYSRTYAYSSGSTKLTDGNGKATTYTIDSSGRVSQTVDARSNTHKTGYDANSNVTSTTDGYSGSTPANVTTYSYDQQNNATGVSYPSGAAAKAVYAQGTSCPGAGSGNPNLPKCTSDDAGNGKQYDYDTAGNLTKTTDTTSSGTGAVTQTKVYEKSDRSVCGGYAGQICSTTDGNGNKTSYTYNTSGDLTKVTPPAPQGATTYQYDSLGRVTTVTDGNNNATTYTYNARDLEQQRTYAGGRVYQTSYYQNGLKASESDSSLNQNTSLTYDGFGRLLSLTGPQSSVTQTYTYDTVGNITSYADANGTVKYGHDATNDVTSITEPGGSCTTPTAANSGCITMTYDGSGKELTRTFPGGAKVTTKRDLSDRAYSIVATPAGSSTPSVSIGYSYGGSPTTKDTTNDRTNIQTRTSTKEQGITAGAVTTYAYDSLSRLKSATEKSGSTTTASWAYTYDKAGNRTQQILSGSTGSTAGTTTYGYNADNELTSTNGDTTTWQYDGAGNQLTNGATGQTATYDSRLAVTGIGSSTYTSFGQGNQQTETRSANSTSYTTANLGLMSEQTSAGTTAYTRNPSGNVVSARTGSNRLYYVLDSIGSVVGVFDSNGAYTGGYSYDPYGKTRSASTAAAITANNMRYIGGYWDSSVNLYRLGARYYDPTLGRFNQADPSGQEANPYTYTNCNPVNKTDPTGLSGCSGAVIAGVAGGIALAASVTALVVAAGPIGIAIAATSAAFEGFVVGGAALGVVGTLAGAFTSVYGIGDIANEC
jgi:RHS repeat-associated protein